MRILTLLAAAVVMSAGMVFIMFPIKDVLSDPAIPFLSMKSGMYVVLAVVAAVAMAKGLNWLWRLDERLKRKTDLDRIAQADQRFAQLVEIARTHDFELKVKGPTLVLWAFFALAVGSTLSLPEVDWLVRAAALVIIIPLGILLLLYAIPQFWKPVITLTRTGFRTATSPEIPWALVDGLHYSETTFSPNDSESAPVGTLTFSIPSLPQETARFSWVSKMLHGLIGKHATRRITVVLRKTGEPPSAVGRLAEHLWKQSTGRTNEWEPYFSDAENAAFRQLKAADAALLKHMESGDPDLAMLDKHLAQTRRINDILLEEADRQKQRNNRAIVIMVIVVLGVAGYIAGRLFRIF